MVLWFYVLWPVKINVLSLSLVVWQTPEYFYSILERQFGMTLIDILRFNAALDTLQWWCLPSHVLEMKTFAVWKPDMVDEWMHNCRLVSSTGYFLMIKSQFSRNWTWLSVTCNLEISKTCDLSLLNPYKYLKITRWLFCEVGNVLFF